MENQNNMKTELELSGLEENQNNMKTELELSGLDPEELEFMDIEERKKVLRAAGLDPKSYDF